MWKGLRQSWKYPGTLGEPDAPVVCIQQKIAMAATGAVAC